MLLVPVSHWRQHRPLCADHMNNVKHESPGIGTPGPCAETGSPRSSLRPHAGKVHMQDPRYECKRQVGVVAFYYPGHKEVWDEMCGSAFLGNFYDVAPNCIELSAPGFPDAAPQHFRNAEAAFQALKHWNRAHEFAELSGEDAFRKKRALERSADWTYGGFGGNWSAMLAVLYAKFTPGSALAQGLIDTGDSFLLEHNSVSGRDRTWSNNHDGDGTNWLGLQLMIIRDELRCEGSWTAFFDERLDLSSGSPRSPQAAQEWQALVFQATRTLTAALAHDSALESNK